jgi:hypothetical protein
MDFAVDNCGKISIIQIYETNHLNAKRDKENRRSGWVRLPELIKAMNQTGANVLRLVRILENQNRIDTDLDGRNGDGSGYQCLWVRLITSK